MKVALYNLTTTTQFGGVETFVWELGRELARRSYRVDIIGGRGPIVRDLPGIRVIQRPFVDRDAFAHIPLLSRRAKFLERLTFGLVALLDLLRERYDIIHIQKPHDLPIAVAAKRLVGTRIVLGCHGTDFAPLDTRLVRWADSAVSCSRFNAAAVAARYGIEPLVVYNGVDLDAFRPLPADPELRRRYARPDEKLLVYVGRLIDWKGLQDIIAALSAGVKPATTLLVIGEGEYRAELERIAKEHGVADRVIFVGYVPHERLPAYYALADVVVAASFAHETFGISLCEGMACGKPVVATAFGGFPEVVEDGVTGFLVPPQNPQALAAKLALLLADEELRRRMGEAGRARMQALFTWGAVADRVEVSYRAAMSQS